MPRGLLSSRLFLLLALLVLLVPMGGCELAGGIFKAGMWVGIFMVAIVLAIVFWVAGKVRG
jgi:hypothetical protein